MLHHIFNSTSHKSFTKSIKRKKICQWKRKEDQFDSFLQHLKTLSASRFLYSFYGPLGGCSSKHYPFCQECNIFKILMKPFFLPKTLPGEVNLKLLSSTTKREVCFGQFFFSSLLLRQNNIQFGPFTTLRCISEALLQFCFCIVVVRHSEYNLYLRNTSLSVENSPR